MANKWKEVRKSLTPEREARIKTRVEAEFARMPLAEVRKAREMTQVRLAELLKVNQGAISKMEQRSDMYLSTLRSYVEAMGGNLDLRAVFPNGEVVLELTGVKGIAMRPKPSAKKQAKANMGPATIAERKVAAR
jgi:DNA-binding XRE family transcriptional regulator